MNNIIKVENLGKKYIISHQGREKYVALRDVIAQSVSRLKNKFLYPFVRKDSRGNPSREEFWALKNVSFEIEKGDRVGVIGRNGAGKTTLLKVLSRITELSKGRVTIKGRVASLLEVGTGFHPELTGRENIFLNGAILGMSKPEIKSKFDEIIAFAEVEKFLDTPVKRYSSGMHVRLAFAVAAHLEPEILLVDEVLAVGDAQFQKKCLGKMEDISLKEDKTILFVSHSMGAVSKLCNKAILLSEGQVSAIGEVSTCIDAYLQLIEKMDLKLDLSPKPNLPCSILGLRLLNGKGEAVNSFDIDDEIIIVIIYQLTAKIKDLQISITLTRNMIDLVNSFDTDCLLEIPAKEPGFYEGKYKIPRKFLKAGNYTARIATGTPRQLIQDFPTALIFEIEEISENTYFKGYRKERVGHVISPGVWQTKILKDKSEGSYAGT